MNKYLLAGALATLAIPSIAIAAPEPKAATEAHHQGSDHQGMKHDGCCPEKKDGEKQGDCCKGMKCCDKMKSAAKPAAKPDAHAGHDMNH